MAIVDNEIKFDEIRSGVSQSGLVIYGVRSGEFWGFGEDEDDGRALALAIHDLAKHVVGA